VFKLFLTAKHNQSKNSSIHSKISREHSPSRAKQGIP